MTPFPPPMDAARAAAGMRRRPAGAMHTTHATHLSIGRLAASIAHEVDQPLAAITLHAHAALRCIERADAAGAPADGGSEGAQAALRALLAASAQASDIVCSMRTLAGSARPARVRCRLDAAVDAVLADAAGDIERLGIACTVAYGRGARTALAHPVQLRQLLRNLVANAIDALRGVAGRPRHLQIDARLDNGGGLRLAIADNGAGMDAALARRVFDPLVTTKASGLGLGLAICRAIVDGHEGRIWAEPQPGQGCVFTFVLPHAVLPHAAPPAGARHG